MLCYSINEQTYNSFLIASFILNPHTNGLQLLKTAQRISISSPQNSSAALGNGRPLFLTTDIDIHSLRTALFLDT